MIPAEHVTKYDRITHELNDSDSEKHLSFWNWWKEMELTVWLLGGSTWIIVIFLIKVFPQKFDNRFLLEISPKITLVL